jgi:hypothetical protein
MTIVAWIILGLIAGFIASKIVNKSGTASSGYRPRCGRRRIGGWLFSLRSGWLVCPD